MQPWFEASDDRKGDDESSSLSGESDERVPTSHIPRERRAGAVTRRKGRELSSLSVGTKTSLGKDVLRSRPALKNEFCAPREGSESWCGKGDT